MEFQANRSFLCQNEADVDAGRGQLLVQRLRKKGKRERKTGIRG